MASTDLLSRFERVAGDPRTQFKTYLDTGRPVVLTAPYYTPAEIIHAMGLAPMGAWGADLRIDQARRYFPSFICSIVQSIVELGIRGEYDGAAALVVPSLCDSLKCLGENWKYAVPQIPFIPMVYPQNRRFEAADAFTIAGYRRVIGDLEKATGAVFRTEALARSIELYNQHNAVMRELAAALAAHPEVTAAQRLGIYKSAWFIPVEEHTTLVRQLLDGWAGAPAGGPEPGGRLRIVTSGVLLDSPGLISILDETGFHIVGDDVAAESRQYATDTPTGNDALTRLSGKHRDRGDCSVLYDPTKHRARHIVDVAQAHRADGVLIALTKFCDPEEFDVPFIRKACQTARLPLLVVEVDRQMVDYAQARTALTAFAELLSEGRRGRR